MCPVSLPPVVCPAPNLCVEVDKGKYIVKAFTFCALCAGQRPQKVPEPPLEAVQCFESGPQTVWSCGPAAVNMDRCLTWIVTLLCLLLLVEAMAEASPYSVAGDDLDDYNDNLARLLFFTRKRSCIRRGGSCDHRPNDCCYNSSCRCNLWGTNCRCQRMGLFQKWGKK